MAVMGGHEPVTTFEQWYVDYDPTGSRDGLLAHRGHAPCAEKLYRRFMVAKNEMDRRVANFEVLDKLADAEVITEKPDLPNVSSGETSGLVLRIARNVVQNTPNVEVVSVFDDDKVKGILSRHVLTSKIIGSDLYSNDMQQNLFASVKGALTRGFDCVIPVLLQDAGGSWYMKYDTIHYRDVYPEPGCKDVRQATEVFVRRYLTEGEVHQIVANNVAGWDHQALKLMLQTSPGVREHQSVAHQQKKHGQIPDGYEIITWYSSSGNPFLTFDARSKNLLRIEKNKHPMKLHPVFFLVLEKDDQQPLGKSQVERLVGRQDFQDLMLNGAMKLWYRNINPSIIGYGAPNAVPNLSPGKYTAISNPNAKIEAFEVNTQTLMQYGSISQNNLGSMVSLIGAADQQMASQAGNGMSATPQGVEAQQQMVDITTNNYQKAVEQFFSHYCSYALTVYFQELKALPGFAPTAEARIRLLEAGLPPETIDEDGVVNIPFSDMAVEYFVRCVPGSLVELEDEKEVRLLNQMFVPLSQAMPAIAASQDAQAIGNAVKAMNYIIARQIELSGARDAKDIGLLWKTGDVEEVNARDQRIAAIEEGLNEFSAASEMELQMNTEAIRSLQEQMSMQTQNMQLLLEKLGVSNGASTSSSPTPEQSSRVGTEQGVS